MAQEKEPSIGRRLTKIEAETIEMKKTLRRILQLIESRRGKMRLTVVSRKTTGRKKTVYIAHEEIVAVRKKLKLTQNEMAERAGVPLRTWIGWENDQFTPSAAAAKLIRLLGEKTLMGCSDIDRASKKA